MKLYAQIRLKFCKSFRITQSCPSSYLLYTPVIFCSFVFQHSLKNTLSKARLKQTNKFSMLELSIVNIFIYNRVSLWG